MFKIKWDEEINGILLTDKTDNEVINSARPVFYEELDLLGFNKYWSYPKSREPLLWAIRRRYYYKGIMVAEAKGGNIFEEPEIIINEGGKNLILEPVDVGLMVAKNEEVLFTLENEAMDFVEHTYKIYKNKVDCFSVAFSGGKDSQVVLDIVSRIIPPDEYLVIFTDTTMELPCTYEAVEKSKETYQKLYPDLRFCTAKHEEEAIELWKKFGPPSRIHRWCGSVCKTAPFVRLVKEIHKGSNQPEILVFDGVRAEESSRRNEYKRIAKSVKHLVQINAEVIKNWNIPEVFLYLFLRNIEINKAYRYGLKRVGCSICPFASNWSEFIINKIFPDLAKEYINVIKEHVELLGIKKEEKIKEYISQRQWKKRGGGEGVNTNGIRIDFIEKENNLEVVLTRPRESFLEWVKTVGDVIYKNQGNNIIGEIKIGIEIFNFKIEKKEDNEKILVKIDNVGRDVISLSKFKKTLYKTTYCIHCGACEVECPTGALNVIPRITIDKNFCTHCSNCLNFVDRGCLMAKSIRMSEGGYRNMKKTLSGFGKYLTFGIRRGWLLSFLTNREDWFANNKLGTKQVDSMVAWLRDAELIEKKQKKTTEVAKILKEVLSENELLIWEIIWINLFYNSSVVKWYLSNIDWNKKYSSNELNQMIRDTHDDISERTVSSGIKSLLNMFSSTPIGEILKLGLIEKEKNIRYVRKIGTDDIHPMTAVYSLYKYAENKKRYDFTVSEFYNEGCDGGPYKLFGVSRDKFENILRWVQENKNEIVSVDLVAGLDNIRLRDDITSLNVLEMIE